MIEYNDALRSIRMQSVIAAVDAGGGFGTIEILDAASNVLCSFTLPKPSFVESDGIIITAQGFPRWTYDATPTGMAVIARIKDSNNNFVVSIPIGPTLIDKTSVRLGGFVITEL